MLLEGKLHAINIELRKDDESRYTVIFDVKSGHGKDVKYCLIPYYPSHDSAKKILGKSRANSVFLCDVQKNLKGQWAIFNVYKNIEELE